MGSAWRFTWQVRPSVPWQLYTVPPRLKTSLPWNITSPKYRSGVISSMAWQNQLFRMAISRFLTRPDLVSRSTRMPSGNILFLKTAVYLSQRLNGTMSEVGIGSGHNISCSKKNDNGDHMKIKKVRPILTAPDGIALVIVKVETDQPGLYGVG